MMQSLFLGPNLLSGIGQVTKRYAELIGGEYVCYHNDEPSREHYDFCFAFVLPISHNLEYIDKHKHKFDKIVYMTVCETHTVNECYGMLKNRKPLYVPSMFAKEILDRQFGFNCEFLPHWATIPRELDFHGPSAGPYIFYTIGNIMDPRKNMTGLLSAFQSCKFPDARLLVKATCKKPITINLPNVSVINGLLTDDQLDKIHRGCHCYVNVSHSEGVGMGAVEAAVRNKPIIITDFGGLKEYVKTPFVVPCKLKEIGFDDFLFKKDMKWGHPKVQDIMECMKKCYNQRLRYMDHTHTRELVSAVQDNLENIAKTKL